MSVSASSGSSTTGPLICPVRQCGRLLPWGARQLVCSERHNFDRGRSGYYNLLQPQDRKVKLPGDSAEQVAARLRLADKGLGVGLAQIIAGVLAARSGFREDSVVLDIGCGPGTLIGRLRQQRLFDGWGMDISVSAVDQAAKRHPDSRWLVANADRPLPFQAESCDVVLSITGPKNPSEFRRILRPDGCLVVAVPGAEDLRELRAELFEKTTDLARQERMREIFADHFQVDEVLPVVSRHELAAADLLDLLTIAYRGARHREQQRAQAVERLTVTHAYDVFLLRT